MATAVGAGTRTAARASATVPSTTPRNDRLRNIRSASSPTGATSGEPLDYQSGAAAADRQERAGALAPDGASRRAAAEAVEAVEAVEALSDRPEGHESDRKSGVEGKREG